MTLWPCPCSLICFTFSELEVFIFLILFANCNELSVSCLQFADKEHVTITLVNELPDNDYWSILVNFESLNGTCSCPLLKAYIALPKQLNDKLILIAYYSPYPDTLVLDIF